MSGNRTPNDPRNPGRTEPTLGNLDQLDRPLPRVDLDDGLPQIRVEPIYQRNHHNQPPEDDYDPRPPRRWKIPLLIGVAVVLAVVAGMWINESRLRGMVPRTDFDNVLHRAQVALQQGHLDGTDGSSARELFEAARALEPDNDSARQGLNDVGRAEIARADAALQAGKIGEASDALTNARELLGGGSDVDRLSEAIAKAQVSTGHTDTLITQAQQALSDDKLDGPDGAAALYQRVLSAEPDNAVARHGLDQVGDAMAAQIQKALAANDVATAASEVDRLAAISPNNSQLPTLRASLSAQQAQAGNALTDAINEGNDALRAGRISGDGNDTALAHYKAALAIDPNNAQAKAGLGQVAEALIVQANAAIDAGDADHAKQLLDQAEAFAPQSADLIAARARLQRPASQPVQPSPQHMPPTNTIAKADVATKSDQRSDDEGDTTPPVALTGQQQIQVADMVQRARQAAARGDIMSPPGNCAYDLYRGALSIDGNNPEALSGLQALPGLVQRQFNDALRGGNLAKAGSLLDALDNLSPGDTVLAISSQRLASAWFDQAEQQLDSGDRNNAAGSLEQGRRLSPNDQRVQQLLARMQGGR
ncbi:hypothetical protein [Dyella sp. 2HG41-7]|uniref:hypothetical protein n=1 Tax=Dyella sp. 2HG41-7 TaxID=2883239 RepID=UPI001F3C2E7F|nr:hypothetical protein [Dyella sp. 2HG41-7]